MAEDVKPALSAEEWADVASDPDWWAAEADGLGRVAGECLESRTDAERRHAAAALALHGQPFGFTQEDVELLRTSIAEDEDGCFDQTRTAMLKGLADRIAALLPRE